MTLKLLIPNRFFLTSGIGVHRERLTAFELALRDADIEQQNLVSISSILPPGAKKSIGRLASRHFNQGRSPSPSWLARKRMSQAIVLIRALAWRVLTNISPRSSAELHGNSGSTDVEQGKSSRHFIEKFVNLGAADVRSFTLPISICDAAEQSQKQ